MNSAVANFSTFAENVYTDTRMAIHPKGVTLHREQTNNLINRPMEKFNCHLRFLYGLLILILASVPVKADIWGELAKGLVNSASVATEQALLQKYINTPSMHSKDMKAFLNYLNNGQNAYAEGDYSTAHSNFYNANVTASYTNDQYLKLIHQKYGLKEEINNAILQCRTMLGLSNDFSGGANNYVGGSSNSTSTSTSSRKCNLCKGTGLKIAEHYSAGTTKWCATCQKTVGTGHQHVRCDLCGGTGTLNY